MGALFQASLGDAIPSCHSGLAVAPAARAEGSFFRVSSSTYGLASKL